MNPSLPVASDLSYEVTNLRRRRNELGSQFLDSIYRPLKLVTGYPVRKFIADVEDSDITSDAAQPNPVTPASPGEDAVIPLWHRHMRKG